MAKRKDKANEQRLFEIMLEHMEIAKMGNIKDLPRIRELRKERDALLIELEKKDSFYAGMRERLKDIT